MILTLRHKQNFLSHFRRLDNIMVTDNDLTTAIGFAITNYRRNLPKKSKAYLNFTNNGGFKTNKNQNHKEQHSTVENLEPLKKYLETFFPFYHENLM